MAYTFPLALPVLADRLPISSVAWDIQRTDEVSGSGDGRVWQAELAAPLWIADVTLAKCYHNEAKQIAAIIRQLDGAENSFMLFDPLSQTPQGDPRGITLGASEVKVMAIAASRRGLRLKGLPVGYALTLGDKFQIVYGSEPQLNYFAEISESVAAGGAGETLEFAVWPRVPIGVAVDDMVILKKPACKMFVMPGSYRPGVARTSITEGISFKAMERKR